MHRVNAAPRADLDRATGAEDGVQPALAGGGAVDYPATATLPNSDKKQKTKNKTMREWNGTEMGWGPSREGGRSTERKRDRTTRLHCGFSGPRCRLWGEHDSSGACPRTNVEEEPE